MTKAESRALCDLIATLPYTVTKCKTRRYSGDKTLNKKSAGAAPASLLDTARRGRKTVSAHQWALALHHGR